MFSCAYDVFVPPARLPMLAPVVGIVACEQLRKVAGPAVQDRLLMKWPNDILYDQAKLSGLLVESTGRCNANRSTIMWLSLAWG